MWVNWPQLLGLPRFTPIRPSDFLYSLFSYCGQTLTEGTELPQLPPFSDPSICASLLFRHASPQGLALLHIYNTFQNIKRKIALSKNILGLRLKFISCRQKIKKNLTMNACRFFQTFSESAPFKKNLSNLLYMCVLILVMLYYSV